MNIPQHNIKDIPALSRCSLIVNRTRRLLLKHTPDTPINILINTGTGRPDRRIPRGGCPLGRFPIDATRDIFPADGKVTGSDVGLIATLSELEFLA